MRARLLRYIRKVEGKEPSLTEAEKSPSGQRRVSPEEI
jgi:hypothetical protein